MGREALLQVPIDELLRRARGGDQEALAALFRRSRPALERWASRRYARVQPGSARPSDFAQETTMRAYERFSTFDGSTEKEWMAWLYKVFLNRATEIVRGAQRQKREPKGALGLDSPEATAAPAPQTSPSQASAIEEEWHRLYTFIFELPDAQREAIWLCHIKEMPVADVASKMDKTPGAVAGLLQRGLKTLRARMAGDPEDGAEASVAPASRNEATDALLIYLRRRDVGEAVDATAFVAEHPAAGNELRAMLDWIARIEAIRPGAQGA